MKGMQGEKEELRGLQGLGMGLSNARQETDILAHGGREEYKLVKPLWKSVEVS